MAAPVLSDDTEIFFGQTTPQNIMLVLDRSGSMDWVTYADNQNPTAAEDSRMEVLQAATTAFLNSLPDNTRVGAMRFNSGDTAVILEEVRALDFDLGGGETQRQRLITEINALDGAGSTPTGRAMYDATRYFRGDLPGFTSPITANCSLKNNMVLITDGQPTRFNDTVRDGIRAYDGVPDDCSTANSGRACMSDLAEYISTTPQVAGNTQSTIAVSTIALALFDTNASSWLQDMAENRGGGTYNTANDTQSLIDALQSAIDTDTESAGFVAPSVPISQSNRLTNGNEVFLAMYRPSASNVWAGNLKKYYIKEGEIRSEDTAQPDNVGGPAVDQTTGEFLDTATSAWGATDGNNVIYGGAGPRSDDSGLVYSNLFSNGLSTNPKNVINEALEAQLSDAQIEELFGTGTTRAEAKEYFKWIAEKQIVTDYDLNNNGNIEPSEEDVTINRFGDPLHSRPTVLNYDANKRTVFVGTNQGYLHAINPSTGNLRWSFMPRQMFKNVKNWKNNYDLSSPDLRDYGLDGDITVYIRDRNKNNSVDALPNPDNDIAMLYIGERRGGNRYYALDVSKAGAPIMRFTVRDDIGNDGVDAANVPLFYNNERITEIPNLGQTWSKPVVGRLKYNGNRRVVMFGGGYDDRNDDYTYQSTSGGQKGNSFHILQWRSGEDFGKDISSLNNFIDSSVPADITFIDSNNDEFLDTAYISDISGKIYRVDMPLSGSASDFKSGKVADLSGFSGNNRFYNRPDIVFDSFDGKIFAMIGIGSGYRAHPLDTGTTDRFHLVYDESIATKTFTTTINSTDLNNNTDPTSSNFKTQQELFADGDKGWYITLDLNEKILSDSTTFNGRTFFTTYTPQQSADVCTPPTGLNRIYGMKIADSTPIVDNFFDNDGVVTSLDRSMDTALGSIVDGLLGVIQTGVKPDGSTFYDGEFLIGTIPVDLDDLLQTKTAKWRETTE